MFPKLIPGKYPLSAKLIFLITSGPGFLENFSIKQLQFLFFCREISESDKLSLIPMFSKNIKKTVKQLVKNWQFYKRLSQPIFIVFFFFSGELWLSNWFLDFY
jgi:hypothetical protein